MGSCCAKPAARRGTALIALVAAFVVLQLVVAVIVASGARDQSQSTARLDGVRAQYAAEGAQQMAYAEVFSGTDLDGDGQVGAISYDASSANNPKINTIPVTVYPGATGEFVVSARSAGAARCLSFSSAAGTSFVDGFESFDPLVALNYIGGWEPWDNLAGAVGYPSSAFAHSGSNSVLIRQPVDLVRRYSVNSGVWTYTAWQYIPSSTTGADHYFILMNTYNAGGTKYWSTQVRFDLANNRLYDNLSGTSGNLAIIRDQWVKIQVDIDLNAKTQTFRYGGNDLFSGGWNRLGGVAALAAVDLFGSTSTSVYYDDIQLTKVGGAYSGVSDLRGVAPASAN